MLVGMEAAPGSAARLLRDLRQAQGRSLRRTAEDLGIAPSSLSRLERGERGCAAELGQRIARYYGVEPELLNLAEGRVPPDIVDILRRHPDLIEDIRSRYRNPEVYDRRGRADPSLGSEPGRAAAG